MREGSSRYFGMPGWPQLIQALALALALVFPACAPKPYRFPPPESPPAGTVQEGIASWYGPGYHGKKTSAQPMS